MEEGLPENLSVSIISEAGLKQLSSDPFRQDPSPVPSNETGDAPEQSQAASPPPKPAVQEANAAASPAQPNPSEQRATSFDPSRFAVMASEQFGSELKQAFQAVEARRAKVQRTSAKAGGELRLTRPGATHIGKSDEWERSVIWALGATVPTGNGKWGSTVVTFAVSASGQVEGLRLLQTSGDNWLDQGALMGVRQARIPAPPAGLPLGDRSFNIEYISMPDH